MQLPLQIAVRNTSLSEAAKKEVHERAVKLDQTHGQIIRCRVTVDRPHRHQKNGTCYEVRIDLTIPGAEWAVKGEPNEDLFVAIRNVFDIVMRRLNDLSRRQKGALKAQRPSFDDPVNPLVQDNPPGMAETA